MIKITTKTDLYGTQYAKEVFIWVAIKHSDTSKINIDCYFSHSKEQAEANQERVSQGELIQLLSLPIAYIVNVENVKNFTNFEALKDGIQQLVIDQMNTYIESKKLVHIDKIELI